MAALGRGRKGTVMLCRLIWRAMDPPPCGAGYFTAVRRSVCRQPDHTDRWWFELQEDGRLQMLLGQDTAARIRTTARVDTSFMRSFEFSLDPAGLQLREERLMDPRRRRRGA